MTRVPRILEGCQTILIQRSESEDYVRLSLVAQHEAQLPAKGADKARGAALRAAAPSPHVGHLSQQQRPCPTEGRGRPEPPPVFAPRGGAGGPSGAVRCRGGARQRSQEHPELGCRDAATEGRGAAAPSPGEEPS